MTMKNFFTITALLFVAILISVYSAGTIAKSNRVTRESFESGVQKEIENFTLAMNNADLEIARLQEENKTLSATIEDLNSKKSVTKKGTVVTPVTTKNKTTTKTTATTGGATKATLTTALVGKHASATDCWIIVSGNVYSVSSYMAMHPGGKTVIINQCGKDATTVFTNRGGTGAHSASAWSMLKTYLVGPVGGSI
jgi:cytochrome b involved in lipid metabolism